jgi:hypothetical protein
MSLKTDIRKEFLDLFYSDIKDQELENSNTLNLFTLRVTNNQFVYNELIELLADQLHYFALSRTEVKKLVDAGKFRTLTDKAKGLLRNHLDIKKNDSSSSKETEGGELGEILLYCLLESHLNAPKILTKLELKTSNQMFVNGADGVHLLKLNDKDYQLIFGESKLNSDLQQGIYKAFESIGKLLSQKGGKKDFEIELVSSQLVKEAYDENSYDVLKKIIIPSASADETNIDHSFGIFLGFNIDIDAEEKKMPNHEFREKIRNKISTQVHSLINSINYQIRKAEFTGYNFYIYVIPFSDLEETRKEIIKELL